MRRDTPHPAVKLRSVDRVDLERDLIQLVSGPSFDFDRAFERAFRSAAREARRIILSSPIYRGRRRRAVRKSS